MLVGQERLPVQRLACTMFVEPDRLRATDLTGMYSTMRIQTGKALVSALESFHGWILMSKARCPQPI